MRHFNFSAGPSTLPLSVLEQAATEMTDWQGTGLGVMEMSHRSEAYESIHFDALERIRSVLNVPSHYKILLMQGGAIAENALIPLNLLGKNRKAGYLVTGQWSAKSAKEAYRYGDITVVADGHAHQYKSLPNMPWQLEANLSYVHYCSNETIDGLQLHEIPDPIKDQVLVADMSSDILSKPIDVEKYGVIYAGAQKNVGPAGVTIVIVREDLLEQTQIICPSAFNWNLVAQNDSMYNTPPTYTIYIMGLVLKWLQAQGGLAEIAKVNTMKAKLLYDFIDNSEMFYNDVTPQYRSLMNVPFFLHNPVDDARFLSGAHQAGLLTLKGHKSVGGMRASIYNAMPLAGVQALVDYMAFFESGLK